MQSIANKAIATVLKYGAIPACKHLITHYGVPCGDCREPFLPIYESAKKDLYENAWCVIEQFRANK